MRYVPARFKQVARSVIGSWAFVRRSYSQEGEDLILLRHFEHRKKGFFVDVGAHHPFRFSNTYVFYRLGWHGINIDPMPGCMALFKRHRARDINLELGVGRDSGSIPFFIFNEPALNTCDERLARQRDGRGQSRLVLETRVPCLPLSQVLQEHLPAGLEHFQFLSIDVEGMDGTVLESNNWDQYRPEVVVIELAGCDLEAAMTSEQSKFLRRVGYLPFAKTNNSFFFRCI